MGRMKIVGTLIPMLLLMTHLGLADPLRFPAQEALPGLSLELSGSWQSTPASPFSYSSGQQKRVVAQVQGMPGLEGAETYQKLMLATTQPGPGQTMQGIKVGQQPAFVLRDQRCFTVYVGHQDAAATIQCFCAPGDAYESLLAEVCQSFRWDEVGP